MLCEVVGDEIDAFRADECASPAGLDFGEDGDDEECLLR